MSQRVFSPARFVPRQRSADHDRPAAPAERPTTAPRVLLVTPSFFGYERSIVEAFERRGAEVTRLDERPGASSVVKVLARLFPFLLSHHFRRALRVVRSAPPDLVVVVKGEVVPRYFLHAVREANPACVLAFYSFDAFDNSPRGARLLDEFDHAFTFERVDAATYGITYKPLFFAPDFARARVSSTRRPVDLAFVGTVHSGRWAICQRLFEAGRANVGFFYSPARWHHGLQWLLRGDVRRIPWSQVSFTKMSRAEVATTFASARAVVDVQRTGQTGLTMRTFEVLSAGAALVTTNDGVRDEDFYDPRWVHVLSGEPESWDLEQLRRFLDSADPAPEALMAPYALEAWVGDFLDLVPAPVLSRTR